MLLSKIEICSFDLSSGTSIQRQIQIQILQFQTDTKTVQTQILQFKVQYKNRYFNSSVESNEL